MPSPAGPQLETPGPVPELLRIALPSVAAMVSYPLKQFVDARMVAALGETAVAAQGNGAIVALTLLAFVMGLLSVVNTFASQCLGAGRPTEAPAYAWNGLWLALLCAVVVGAVALAVDDVFALMGHTGALLELESAYARTLLLGAFFPMAARGMAYFFYGVHKPGVVLVAMVVGLVVNIGLNALLIQGRLGFPAWGIVGAGVATVAASASELLIPLALFLSPRFDQRFHTLRSWKPSLNRLRQLWRVGWPAGLMLANELVCWGVFMAWIIPLFGEVHNAASWIALRYMQLSFMPTVGLQIAVTAVVGKRIGAGDVAGAHQRAMVGVLLGMAYMGVFALAMVLFRRPMIQFFVTDAVPLDRAEAIVRIGSQVMIFAAVFQVFDALGIILIGALRGAGDTLAPGLLMAALAWTALVGGAAVAAHFLPRLGVAGPWSAATVYIILVGAVMALRYRQGRWRGMSVLSPGALASPT